MTNKIERKYYLPLDMPDGISDEEIAGCYEEGVDAVEDIKRFLELVGDHAHADELQLMIMKGDDHVLHDVDIEDDLWWHLDDIYHAALLNNPVNEATRESLKSAYRKFIDSVLFGEL